VAVKTALESRRRRGAERRRIPLEDAGTCGWRGPAGHVAASGAARIIAAFHVKIRRLGTDVSLSFEKMMRECRGARLQLLDWSIFGLTIAISVLGAVNLLGVSYGLHRPMKPTALLQVLWVAVGAAAMAVVSFLDYRTLFKYIYLFYANVVLLLLTVAVCGHTMMGAQRWIDLGLFTVEPSELTKFVLILLSSYHLGRAASGAGPKVERILTLSLVWSAPVALVGLQPDFGTLGILMLIFVTVLFAAGVRGRSFVLLALSAGSAAPLALGLLKPYQIERIETFLDPRAGAGDGIYQVMEAQVAIGSGGLYGKGLFNSTRAFVTDFVFAPFAEQFGFFGALVLLSLYTGLLAGGLWVAYRAKDKIGCLLAVGVVAWIFWQSAINMAMACGLLPVVGIPLPFVSYGGSSLVPLMAAAGLLISVDRHQRVEQQSEIGDGSSRRP
jgi:rod shape determining protein RodA